jgi:phosphoacetylglucosamine mutase
MLRLVIPYHCLLSLQLSVMQVLAVSRLMNQAVGDAIGGMLLVEVVLRSPGMSWSGWEQLYTDLPNKQLKLKVADRNIITTADAERLCKTPEGRWNCKDQGS